MNERARSLADLVAPFGRLPAAAVALLADALLERMALLHDAGTVGLDLQPGAITVTAGGVQLAPATTPAPWLCAPERGATGAPTIKADLFALGALLLELLCGRRVFDAGSAEATTALLARLKQPPPIAVLWPTTPGFLEHVLLALLHPDVARRPPDAASAHASIAAPIASLRARFPDALSVLVDRPQDAARHLHEAQAVAEGERGAALVADPRARVAAAVCLLRAQALLPGLPQVVELLGQAAAAGLIRGARPEPLEVTDANAHIAQAEPDPSPALLRKAATLHLGCGNLLEALGLMKRVMLAQPTNRILAAQLAELAPDAVDAPFAVGGEWVLAPIAAATAARNQPMPASPATQAPFAADEEQVPGPIGQVLRALGQAYGRLEPRARLFLMVLTGSGLVSGALLVAQRTGSRPNRAVQMGMLAQAAADCEPGGRVVLIKAMQAAQLGEAELAQQLLGEASELVPMGTRCHEFGMRLTARAEMARRDAR
ncbi:MAG: hypothetical protein HYS27_09925 [Deltaproteobacteria bacterium]|nr:hypothetical protein [Deltaproteobacteria bacterium]